MEHYTALFLMHPSPPEEQQRAAECAGAPQQRGEHGHGLRPAQLQVLEQRHREEGDVVQPGDGVEDEEAHHYQEGAEVVTSEQVGHHVLYSTLTSEGGGCSLHGPQQELETKVHPKIRNHGEGPY